MSAAENIGNRPGIDQDFVLVGKAAYEGGQGNFPFADPAVLRVVGSRTVGDPVTRKVLEDFNAGWTVANLTAPIPE